MMKRERLERALASCGAVLKRQKKHLVYALPNGKSFTIAATPSDSNAEKNALTDLRHALGVEPRLAVVNPPREKRNKPGRIESERWASPLASALKVSGVAGSAELAKAREVERELRWKILSLEADLVAARRHIAWLESPIESLWMMRVFRAFQRWKTTWFATR